MLHRNGIVHRDIKPQNLLLSDDGEGAIRVMVADLGVAKAMAHGSALNQVVGTPAYMAPEQVHGTGVDERADVHALGAVAYVLLTGHPVRADTLEGLLTAKLPPRPSSLADVPVAFDAPILKSLEPNPDNRYRSVEAFLDALAAAELGASTPAEPQEGRPVSANSRLAVTVLLLVLVLAAFYVAVLFLTRLALG